MRSIVFITTVFLAITSVAQDFKRDLLAVNRNMGTLTKYSVTMKYAMYVDGKTDKPYSSKKVNISMNKDFYNMVEDNTVEIIENKDETLVIDHVKKMVVVNTMKQEVNINSAEADNVEYNEMMDLIENNYDSLMNLAEKITVLSYNYPYKTYEVHYARYSEYSKAIYTVDLKNKVFKSIKVYYSDPDYVQGMAGEHMICMLVDYENFRVNTDIPESTFDMNKYLQKLPKKKYVLKGAVKNYKLEII